MIIELKNLPKSILFTFFCFAWSIFCGQILNAQNAIQVAGTPTKTAAQSGNWTAPATWGGSLPTADARILIPAGITVTVDAEIDTEFKSLRIDGKLIFSTNTNTELRVEYIVSTMMGQLEIGTTNNPIANNVTAKLVFAERGGTSSTQDPERFAPGAVLMGTTTMHGTNKTSWLALQTHPSAGATQINLKSVPSGWKQGDKIVIAGTDPITNASISSTNEIGSDEVVTITNVSGNTVTFTPALRRSHKAPSQAPDLDVHVANLSRNIIISSENTSVRSISGEFRKPRGHIMFMHTLNVDVRYVEANNLGRTDKSIILDDWDFDELARDPNTGNPVPNGKRNPRGRYSIHFHRGGFDAAAAKPITPLPTPAKVEGCVVNNDPGWGYVNHSARVDFVRNVSYNVVGGAFNTEAGNETGSFIENIAIRTINPQNPVMVAPHSRESFTDGDATTALADLREGRQDFAWQGDGFWLHGTGVTVRGNVVAGCTGHAYVYWTDGLIEKGLGMARGDIDAHVPAAEFPTQNRLLKDWKARYPNFALDIWYLQPRPFTNNTAYNFARGVTTYYVHTEFHQANDPNVGGYEERFNNLPPAYKDQLNLIFDNTTLWNIGRRGFMPEISANITIQNSRIVGYNARTGFEDYGTNPNPTYVRNDPAVIGIDLDHYHNTHRWILNNNIIEGFAGNSVGMALPKNGLTTVNGGTFNNGGTDILVGCASEHISDGDEGLGVGMLSTNPTKSEILIQGAINFQNPNRNIVMDAEIIYDAISGEGFPLLEGAKPDDTYFFAPQEVTLNFGPFDKATAYFDEQEGSHIPITSANRCTFSEDREECVASRYVGKSNTQLKSQYNNSFLGTITPTTAVQHPMLVGGKVSAISGNPCESTVPTAPTSITATNNDCNSIALSWASVNCADVYRIERKIGTGNWSVLNASVTGTNFTDSSPASETNQYRVSAQNSNGNSDFSNSNSINCSPSAPIQYTLSISTVGNGGGTVVLNPAGGTYEEGTVVTLTANANNDTQFDGWSGAVSGTNNPISVTMNSNQSVTASFSLTTTGGGGDDNGGDNNGDCTWSTINSNDFESGWGIWNDGGSDARRGVYEDFAVSGEYAIRLRDNTNTSVMTTDDLDLRTFNELKVAFSYVAVSMDNTNEDFWLQISIDGGDTFTTIEEWNRGDEFENEVQQSDEVTISGINFTSNTQLRFRCDASGNSDWVYIDDVTISGCSGNSDGNDDNGDDSETGGDSEETNGIIEVINFSFEEPGSGEYEHDFSVIPGWNKGGDGDSGVERGWGEPTDGNWLCFHQAGDNYVNQTLNHTIQAGRTYTLEVDVVDLEEGGANAQVLLRYGSRTIKNTRLALTDSWQTMTITFNSNDYPNAIGQPLRIFFRNNGEEDSYAGFDNFRLSHGAASRSNPSDTFKLQNKLQLSENQKLTVFPNPIGQNQILTLNISGFSEDAMLSIIDVSGRMRYRGNAFNNLQIPLEDLSVGLYFVKVEDKLGTKTTRFVVQE